MQGPNVRKLIVTKMSLIMVPPGSGTIYTALEAMVKPGNIGDVARQATEWVEAAIAAVKMAHGNPYGDDDEAIAGEILRQVEKRKKSQAEERHLRGEVL